MIKTTFFCVLMCVASTSMAQSSSNNESQSAAEVNGGTTDMVSNNDSIYTCETGNKAEFKGGEAAFRGFVADKFIYPKRCYENGISGSVLIRFVVEKDGKLSNLTVIEQSAKCPEFAAEALRVVRSSPRWIPGKHNGNYVRSYRELPIIMAVE